jgi:dihydroorotate dehydrogenase (NAD+) catalytic subunit
MTASLLLRYDPDRSYRHNYDHPPPLPADVEPPAPVPGEWTFCRRRVASPLGMPAGPLLNGKWILYYAALGFDVLTYKTVRSVARECYPLPNLQPVATGQLTGDETEVPTTIEPTGSWAVSFGMPSAEPDTWRADVEWTRRSLSADKLLSVSVVGSVQPEWSLSDLADDYARCAKWAVESGADAVESNFSCPNVSTCDGQLYQQPKDAALVAERIRDAIGKTPYIIKIGSLTDRNAAAELLDAVAPFVDALAMTNSVAAKIRRPDGSYLFDGQRRGICGDATRTASLQQTLLFCDLIRERGLNLSVIGVGGISTAEHVRQFLDVGAESVHIATAAMLDPSIALKIRKDLATDFTD